jgi:DNA repair photolyase
MITFWFMVSRHSNHGSGNDSQQDPFLGPTRALGRGAATNPANRFERIAIEFDPPKDGPGCAGVEETASGCMGAGADERPILRTQFYKDHASSLISRNTSPDLGFEYTLNVYRGCEHGCAYCYARPYHEYLGFSGGLDFESKIMVKEDAPDLLREELAARTWRVGVLAMSGVTDCYQPVERRLGLTRRCLAILAEFRQPVSIITKNALVVRDLDHLAELTRYGAVRVTLSITTLDPELGRAMEPRASLPAQRLAAIRAVAAAGVPACVNIAPIIPGLNDHEIPTILAAAAEAGAVSAGWGMLRLPLGVKDVFLEWLDRRFPGKKNRILARIRDVRGGRLDDSAFGVRMTGEGIFAEQIRALFRASARRHGLDRPLPELSAAGFRRPGGSQLELFSKP